MKKITFLFSLLLTFLGVSTAWAQTFHVSDAPTETGWGAHTYWYTIMNGNSKGYLSTANKKVDGLTLTTTTLSDNDNEKWCVVGSETEGYRFYNKAEGYTKVLGITNKSGDTYGNSRANMVEYTSSSVSSTANDEVGFNFIRLTPSFNSNYDAFKLAGVDNDPNQRYMNKRGDYLAYWNYNNEAVATDAGSSFLFTPVDEFEKAVFDAKQKLADASSFVGVVLGCTQESYDAALAIYNQYKDLDQYSVENKDAATAALKGISFTTLNMTDGMQVILGNKQHTNLYVFAKETNRDGVKGGHLGSGSAKDSYRYLFTFKDAGDGKFKIYSNYYDKYVGGVPGRNNLEFQLVDAGSAQAFTVKASANNLGYGSIYDENTTTTSDSVVVNALHMVNWNNNPAGNGVVRWEASAPASTFKFIPVTPEITGAWDAAIIKKASNPEGYVGYTNCTSEVVSALEAFQTASADTKGFAYKTLEEVLSASELVKPVAGKYYTIENACSDNSNKFIIENYGVVTADSENQLVAKSYEKNIVPALWMFEQLTTEGKTDLYHIVAANSGKCMSKTSYGYTMHVTDADNANVGEFDLFTKNHVSKDFAVTLVTYTNSNRTDRGTASMDNGGGAIKSWNAIDNNNNWRIKEVTEIPVAISEARYATLNLPCAVTIPAGVKAYTATDGVNEITLSEIEGNVIPAKTPVILVGEAGSYNFAINTDNTAEAISTAMSGTLVPVTVAADASAYILKNGAQGIGMYKITSETDRTIAANKAYMGSTTAASSSNMKVFNFGGTSTGINNAVAGNAKNNVYYDLNGRRVLYPAHGVFVKANGEKVYIK